MQRLILPIFLLLPLIWLSCSKTEPGKPAPDTILTNPVEGLTHAQMLMRQRGDRAFSRIFSGQDGLGPVFVAGSCESCHAGDGKGHPFTTLTRFGQKDSTGNHYLAQGGPQWQNRAIPGFNPEVIPDGASASRFTAPVVAGAGFLEGVPDALILEWNDPYDINNDGISGVPCYINLPGYVQPAANAVPKGQQYIGRFGKKASVYNLLQQTANAYNQDMGITSLYQPLDPWTRTEAEPEISTNELNDVVFYLRTLQKPLQRNTGNGQVLNGEKVFKQIGCEKCHRSTLRTGYSEIHALSEKEFHPYTDLLLHDMGPSLDDGYTEGTALTSEWRTAPLWGLGLAPDAQGGKYYLMHDGRAGSIEEAVLMHGGEAMAATDKYKLLSQSEKEELMAFLKSL